MVCTGGKGTPLWLWLLILTERRWRCDHICWIPYESTFHFFGRMQLHLSDVPGLETWLNKPWFQSAYGVCILILALEMDQVPQKVVSHGSTCWRLPSFLSFPSIVIPFPLLAPPPFPYPLFLSSLPFFSCFYLRNENMFWKSSFAKPKETLTFSINVVNSRSLKKSKPLPSFPHIKCSPSLALNLQSS